MTAKPGYFTRLEWASFWITTLVSFSVYVYTLAPNVTMEDSGEFLTAAYCWGVPHPPGYPIWTISANLFELLIPYGNAAWRCNLMSAFYGALSDGLLTLITCKIASRLWLTARFKDFVVPGISRESLSMMGGIVAGLVFAFIDTMWAQSTITEVYTLNSFFFTILCLLVLRWFDAPEQDRWVCLMALVFGLGFCNHQTMLVSAPCFLFAMRVANRQLYRDTALLAAIACTIVAWRSTPGAHNPVTAAISCLREAIGLGPLFFLMWKNGLWFAWLFGLYYFADWVYLMYEKWEPERRIESRTFFSTSFALMLGLAGMQILDGEHKDMWKYWAGAMAAAWIVILLLDQIRDPAHLKKAIPFFLAWVAGAIAVGVYVFAPHEAVNATGHPSSFGQFLPWVIHSYQNAIHHSKSFSQYACFALLGLWLFLILCYLVARSTRLRTCAPFLLSFLMFLLGSSFYAYMPTSATTNPPMNWGHTLTMDEFVHHISRGQYEPIQLARSGDPREASMIYIHQNIQFMEDLLDNFTLPLTLLGVLFLLLFLLFITEFPAKERAYILFSMLCFVFMGLVLVYLLNPKFDQQSMFILRVFYSLAHGVFAFWIGLGAILFLFAAQQVRNYLPFLVLIPLMAIIAVAGFVMNYPWYILPSWLGAMAVYLFALSFLTRHTQSRTGTLTLMYLLPLLPLTMNWSDSEMRGHDFGWRYGHDMLKDMDRDAVVYGGTDPGRFVPTYMIFVESFQPKKWRTDPDFDRRDLYIITQNALADQTYMNYIRDHYDVQRPKMDQWYHKLLGRDETYPKEPLRLPSDEEFGMIFSKTIQENLRGPNGDSSGISVQRDSHGIQRASVSGVQGVFAINGGISRWIFDHNKAKHTFYLEESYPIPWMFPYLEPFGLIMKLNKEPLKELDPKMVRRDRAYWYGVESKLLCNEAFLRDEVARKSYSKLRSALAGLYGSRGMLHDQERALLEALEFYPGSSEARAHLAMMYTSQGRYDKALKSCEEWLALDPQSPGPLDVARDVQRTKNLVEREKEFDGLYEYNKNDPNFIFQYIEILRDRGKWPRMDEVVDKFLDGKTATLLEWTRAVQFYGEIGRPDRCEAILARLTKREPKSALAWLNLAMVQCALMKADESCASLEKAIRLDTNLVQQIRMDEHFNPIRATEKFQKLIK